MKEVQIKTEKHKKDRYKWATEHVPWKLQDWKPVVSYDEKRFCLDGPDGFAFYRNDLRYEPKVFYKHQQGGKEIIIWADFTYGRLDNLCWTSDNRDYVMYCDILGIYSFRLADQAAGVTFLFHQDGGHVQRSNGCIHKLYKKPNFQCSNLADEERIQKLWQPDEGIL